MFFLLLGWLASCNFFVQSIWILAFLVGLWSLVLAFVYLFIYLELTFLLKSKNIVFEKISRGKSV